MIEQHFPGRLRGDRHARPRDNSGKASPVGSLAIAAAAFGFLVAPPSLSPQQLPAGFTQVPERAGLAAIDDPEPVAAAGAPIAPDTWIVGVDIDGTARAYDLDLLSGHEVVNDRIGDVAFAVAWSPYANAAVVYDRVIDGATLEFEPTDGLINGASVLRDRQTGTYWSMMRARAEAGPLAGTRLAVLPVSDRMTWRRWVALHPNTEVLTAAASADAAAAGTELARLREFYESDEGYAGLTATDRALETKRPVYGFHRGDIAYAADARGVIGGRSFELQDGTHVLLYREAGDGLPRATAAFVSEAGFEQRGGSWFDLATDAEFNAITRDFSGADVARLNGFDTFWYTWSLANPGTELLR